MPVCVHALVQTWCSSRRTAPGKASRMNMCNEVASYAAPPIPPVSWMDVSPGVDGLENTLIIIKLFTDGGELYA